MEDAIARAKDVGQDLIEVAPNAKPPVAKILNYGKLKYEEKKKAQAELKAAVEKQGASLVKKVKGVIVFDIGPGQAAYTVDLKNGSGSVSEGKTGKADLTISVSDDNFAAMAAGKLNAQSAFMSGKIKIKGNMGLAMKLGTVLKAAAAQSKL